MLTFLSMAFLFSDNTIPLSVQYRMNQDITNLANHMTYQGQLECGNNYVAQRQLKVDCWPTYLPVAARDAPVAFFDTGLLQSALESKDDLGIFNPGEAELVHKLAKIALKMGYQDEEKPSLGIIAPYR